MYTYIVCDSPTDGGRGTMDRERDKQASGVELHYTIK